MSEVPEIVILCGGCSEEREVSLRSGLCCERGLAAEFSRVRRVVMEAECLPEGLDACKQVVFPLVHGAFGEDGQLQALLEKEGFAYAGSASEASRLCMHKVLAKERVAAAGVPVLPHKVWQCGVDWEVHEVIKELGEVLVIKPEDGGSSVGVCIVEEEASLRDCIQKFDTRSWMIEPRFKGREMTVGLLGGEPMGVVEVVPEGGLYDYKRKYEPGHTRYHAPAELEASSSKALREAASAAFKACGCRDFARADFLINEEGRFVFLEINTLPGLTESSLLPKSAACRGMDFPRLCKQMVQPALQRYREGIRN